MLTEVWGADRSRPSAVLVHGSVTSGADTWSAQRSMAEERPLIVVSRDGYFPGPEATRTEDFAADAADLTVLLGELFTSGPPEGRQPSHLVGHSYGAVAALLAAAQCPEAVLSLTLSEPPAFALAQGEPGVDEFVAALTRLWDEGPADPADFLRAFCAAVGSPVPGVGELPPRLAQNARVLRTERGPWEAQIPIERLRELAIPTLVISGGHSPVFDAVCDHLEARLGARRAVLTGAGHRVQTTGRPYNALVGAFWSRVESSFCAG